MKYLSLIFLAIFLGNCTRYVLSPGINSDLELSIRELKNPTDKSNYKLTAFKLSNENLESSLYDANNFSFLNANFTRNFEHISEDIKASNFALIMEVFSKNGLDELNKLDEIEIENTNCLLTKYIIYRYDYIKFVQVRGNREKIYPLIPEDKYQFEFIPKMAYVEISQLPRKRILIYFDKSCNIQNLRQIKFKIKVEKYITYFLDLTPSV